MCRSDVIALVTVALVVGSAATARAEESALRLRWDAPGECPSEKAVHAAATRGAADIAPLRPLHANARVTRSERWRVELHTSGGNAASDDGERTLDASSCAELAEATAVVLALALTGALPAPPPAPASAAPSPAEAPASAPASHAPAERSERDAARALLLSGSATRQRFSIGVGGATSAFVLPAPAPAAMVSVAWTTGRARLAASIAMSAAQSANVEESAAGARFDMRAGDASACFTVTRTLLSLAPCAGATLHDVRARGRGVAEAFEPNAQWVTADLGARAAYPLGDHVVLAARADALAALARPTFVVEGEGVVHRPAPIGLRLGLAVELHFL
jgi:hypothetical protein